MRKVRHFFIAISLVMSFWEGKAQTQNYVVSKFVVSAIDQELQIRQEPDSKAARLVFVREDEADTINWMVEVKWDSPNYKRTLVSPFTAPVLCVIGESGGWYKVYMCKWYGWLGYVKYVGYVPKADCKDAVLMQPTNDQILKEIKYNAHIRISGDYKDYVCLWGGDVERLNIVSETLTIGRISKNMLIVNDFYSYSEDDGSVSVKSFNHEVDLLLSGQKYLKDGGEDYKYADFSCLSDDQMKVLLTKTPDDDCIFYLNIQGVGLYDIETGTLDNHRIIIRGD